MKEILGILLSLFDYLKFCILSLEQEHLVLSDCKISTEIKHPYSEIDELNFCLFNSNNDCGHLLIELVFEPIDRPYSQFYMGCLSLRTDNGLVIKINQPSSIKELVSKNYTKVNKFGQPVIGFEYFFRNEKEREIFYISQSVCFEGYLSLRKKNKSFGFVCKAIQKDACWHFTEGNTYRIYKRTNIRRLYH